MKQSICIFCFALSLWVVPLALGEANKNFSRMEALITPAYATARQKVLGDLVMMPSKNIQQAEKMRMRSNCKGVGMKCQHAEECCTFLCLRRYNECVF